MDLPSERTSTRYGAHHVMKQRPFQIKNRFDMQDRGQFQEYVRGRSQQFQDHHQSMRRSPARSNRSFSDRMSGLSTMVDDRMDSSRMDSNLHQITVQGRNGVKPHRVSVTNGMHSSWFSSQAMSNNKARKISFRNTNFSAPDAGQCFSVYLSNVPENATVKNINGAIRAKIGRFRSASCAFLPELPGTVELVMKNRDAMLRLLQGPIMIFGVAVHVSADLKRVEQRHTYYPVYVRGLPANMPVKEFLGLAKKIVGDFVAMNKVTIDIHGCSKITFQSKKLQSRFLENCDIDDLRHMDASIFPFFGDDMVSMGSSRSSRSGKGDRPVKSSYHGGSRIRERMLDHMYNSSDGGAFFPDIPDNFTEISEDRIMSEKTSGPVNTQMVNRVQMVQTNPKAMTDSVIPRLSERMSEIMKVSPSPLSSTAGSDLLQPETPQPKVYTWTPDLSTTSVSIKSEVFPKPIIRGNYKCCI